MVGRARQTARMRSSRELDDLLADRSEPVATLLLRVREVLLAGQPGLVERVRPGWHSVNFHHSAAGFVCALFPLADRVQLVFERGALLPDPDHRLGGTGRQVRTLEFAAEEHVDTEVVLEFLDLAVDLGARSWSRGVRG
jgi:hypothetical protein